MKRFSFILSVMIFQALLLFLSCQLVTDINSESESSSGTSASTDSSSQTAAESTANATSTTTWNYSVSSPIYEVSSAVKSLSISGLSAGQTLYLSKTNPTSSSISSSKTQYVSSATNLKLSTAEASSSQSGNDTSSGTGGQRRHHFVSPQAFSRQTSLQAGTARQAASSFTKNQEVTQITPVVNSTTKTLYIDCDSDMGTYKSATATLRAIGEYCYIWVVDGYYESDSTGTHYYKNSKSSYKTTKDEQISSTIAKSIADNFDGMYPIIRNVFGNESDEIFYEYSGNSFSTADIKYLSDTGYMVNIVIYDIGSDHSNDDETGVLGYFYAKDYYPNGEHISSLSNGSSYQNGDVLNYSNEGKYFYVDAYYSVEYTDTVLSTLAHEFQHMIDWGVKYMEQDVDTSTGFNEMLSMLCEDLMQEYLGISDSDSPKGRLPLFNQYYYDCGLEYRTDSSYLEVLSYSTNYAFGSWIARQFGGAKVISEMSRNAYADIEAIVNAVNTVNGTSYAIEDLLRMYTLACTILADAGDTYNWPTFNQSSSLNYSDTLYYDDSGTTYSYPLSAINLWTLKTTLSDFYDDVMNSTSASYYKFDGPNLLGYNAQKDLRPYGITLSQVGIVSSDDEDVTVTFGNSSPSINEKVYLIVR